MLDRRFAEIERLVASNLLIRLQLPEISQARLGLTGPPGPKHERVQVTGGVSHVCTYVHDLSSAALGEQLWSALQCCEHTDMYLHMYMYMYMYIYIHTYMYVFMFVCVSKLSMCVYIYMYLFIRHIVFVYCVYLFM